MEIKVMNYLDIEIQADRYEEEQEILNLLFEELVENGEEFRIFPEKLENELPF